MTNTTKFQAITNEMAEIYEKKNHDYGNSFDQSIAKYGLVAAAVRMEDKLNRFLTLITKEAKVSDKSMTNTLTDLANYAIMTRMYIETYRVNGSDDEQRDH